MNKVLRKSRCYFAPSEPCPRGRAGALPRPQSQPWALSPEPWALAAGGPGPRWRQRAGCCFRFPLDGCGGPFLESPALCQFRDPISVLVVPTLVSLGPGFVSWKSFYVLVLELTSGRTFCTSTSQGESGGLSVVWGRRVQEWHLVARQGHWSLLSDLLCILWRFTCVAWGFSEPALPAM